MDKVLILIAIVILLGGIAYILKKGFNEVIRGLESVDDRLKRLEDLMKNK